MTHSTQLSSFNQMKQSLDNQFSSDWENWLSSDTNKSWKALKQAAGPSAGNLVIYPGTQRQFEENASDNLGFFRNMFDITEEVSAGTNSTSAPSRSDCDETKGLPPSNSNLAPLSDGGVALSNQAFVSSNSASVSGGSFGTNDPLNRSDSSVPVQEPTLSVTSTVVTNRNERGQSRKCVIPFVFVAVAVATLAHVYLQSQKV